MSTVRTPLNGGELATMERLVNRLQRNIPRSGNPERFHLEKSDIVDGLRRAIGALRVGHRIPHVEEDGR